MDRRTLLAGLGATLAAPWARAQGAYPDPVIKWVVPYPAGGGTDVIARTLAEAMRQPLGQQLVIDNRPGASTNIGAELVARAKPDGYTLMSADNAEGSPIISRTLIRGFSELNGSWNTTWMRRRRFRKDARLRLSIR